MRVKNTEQWISEFRRERQREKTIEEICNALCLVVMILGFCYFAAHVAAWMAR